MEEQYYEDDITKYLTVDVMSKILSEFSWPGPYTFDDDYPPHIVVKFPKSKLVFLEDFESNIHLIFSNDDTKRGPNQGGYKLGHAMTILIPEAKMNKDFQEPALTSYLAEPASLDKVQNMFRNLCVIIQTYLLPSVQGGFSWVERYDAYIRDKYNSK